MSSVSPNHSTQAMFLSVLRFFLNYEVFLPLSVLVTRSGLLLMCVLAGLRFFSVSLDEYLSYGKLQSESKKSSPLPFLTSY